MMAEISWRQLRREAKEAERHNRVRRTTDCIVYWSFVIAVLALVGIEVGFLIVGMWG